MMMIEGIAKWLEQVIALPAGATEQPSKKPYRRDFATLKYCLH